MAGLLDFLSRSQGGSGGLLGQLTPTGNSSSPPTSMDYFLAGGKDFGADLTNLFSGNLTGPNFDARRALFAREPAAFNQRFPQADPQIDPNLMSYLLHIASQKNGALP